MRFLLDKLLQHCYTVTMMRTERDGEEKAMTRITGKTYEVKDKLKAAGCRWDAESRCWLADEEAIGEIMRVVSDYAITRLLFDGRPKLVWTISGAVPATEATPAASKPAAKAEGAHTPCRHCGTYCYGDCQAA